MSKTIDNLKTAFAGESQANRRYLAFAQKAADESREGIYKLFTAVAEAETIHALRHLSNLKEIKGTKENLEAALAGELHEFKTIYPLPKNPLTDALYAAQSESHITRPEP